MSKPFKDPSLLTKDRLKKELEGNGIKLPRGDQKKEFYVRLYQENLSPQQAGRRLGNGEFSSDDDDYERSEPRKEIVPRTSRSMKKVGSKEIISSKVKSMTNEELREELSEQLGEAVGPILPSTRGLYEQKLARLQATSPKSISTVVSTITNSEFSDDNEFEEQEPEEENIPDDEFSYSNQSQRNDDFGSTFSKNFEGSSSKKEVTRDFSMSSSRNFEKSSSFDRKTVNKVRTKKGDKFEEKNWSSSDDNEKDEGINMNSLPTNIQKALNNTGRLTPEKENGTEVRERSSRKSKPEQVSEKRSRSNVEEKLVTKDKKKVKKSETSSRKWWILLFVLILLVVLAVAVVLNVERLPIIQQQFIPLPAKQNASSNTTLEV